MERESLVKNAFEGNGKNRNRQIRLALILLVFGWTYAFNVLIKGQGIVRGFFEILNTISEDFIVGMLITIGCGIAIVVVFSLTKLYSQIIANVHSFAIIETLATRPSSGRRLRQFAIELLHFEQQPLPERCCPQRLSFVLTSLSFMYGLSWIYLILFTEALFFVSWSAGVDLPLGEAEKMLLLPTLALAIPFSVRVMAYLRYPYTQDYADFMPGAVFVLLLVVTLGTIFESHDQKFFLLQVWQNPEYLKTFLCYGVVLAFVPVFFESAFWIWELTNLERSHPTAQADNADTSDESN